MASSEEAVPKPAVLHIKPLKLLNTNVSVAEPSKRKVSDGEIQLIGGGRSRSSSGSTSSLKGLCGKDVWMKAELYLTETTLCYNINDVGVRDFFCYLSLSSD